MFLEISSLSTYVLIALGQDRRALVAAYQYLIMGTIGATFYVIGVGLLYLMTGTPQHGRHRGAAGAAGRAIRGRCWRRSPSSPSGISLKLALFPLHVWLPNAYAYAPSCATVFLAATATKVAVYLLLRFYFPVFGVAVGVRRAADRRELLLALSLAAMFVASLLAMFQSDLKRMLAYSCVAQIGYITLGLSLGNEAGLTGGIVHLFNHAVMKGALFLARRRGRLSRCGTVQTRRPRPGSAADAADHGRLRDRRARPDRHARHRRLHHQVVPGRRRARHGAGGRWSS